MNKGREEGKNKQTNEQVFKRKKERMDVIMDYVHECVVPAPSGVLEIPRGRGF